MYANIAVPRRGKLAEQSYSISVAGKQEQAVLSFVRVVIRRYYCGGSGLNRTFRLGLGRS